MSDLRTSMKMASKPVLSKFGNIFCRATWTWRNLVTYFSGMAAIVWRKFLFPACPGLVVIPFCNPGFQAMLEVWAWLAMAQLFSDFNFLIIRWRIEVLRASQTSVFSISFSFLWLKFLPLRAMSVPQVPSCLFLQCFQYSHGVKCNPGSSAATEPFILVQQSICFLPMSFSSIFSSDMGWSGKLRTLRDISKSYFWGYFHAVQSPMKQYLCISLSKAVE